MKFTDGNNYNSKSDLEDYSNALKDFKEEENDGYCKWKVTYIHQPLPENENKNESGNEKIVVG